MELYYKEERDRDLYEAYNKVLKSLGMAALDTPREKVVHRVVYSVAPRFYISYEEARRNVKRIMSAARPGAYGRSHRDVQRPGQSAGRISAPSAAGQL